MVLVRVLHSPFSRDSSGGKENSSALVAFFFSYMASYSLLVLGFEPTDIIEEIDQRSHPL